MNKTVAKMSFVTRTTITKSLCLCVLGFLLVTGNIPIYAQMSSVTPVEYTGGMTNPLMGFRQRTSDVKKDYPFTTLVRSYIGYNVLENTSADGVQKIINYTNTTYSDFEKYNFKVIPRVILMWDETDLRWPSDVPYNWTSDLIKNRVVAFIAKMGQVWDKDPRIAFIEVGFIGKWGEQESPVGIDEPIVGTNKQTWAQIIGPAFKQAFPNKKYMVRSMQDWADDIEAGVYWDSYGAYKRMTSSTDDYQQILLYNKPPYERYKIAPMEGEVAYSQSNPLHIGNNENETVQNANFRQWFIDNIKSMHSTTCGLEYDASLTANDFGSNLIQKAFGYRFLINKFECSPRTEPGGNFSFSAKILNDGSAPMYENWPLAVVLINETTKQIVHKSILPTVDITKWLPGSDYDWTPQAPPSFGVGSRVYKNPAVENTVAATIQIPSNLPVGQYLVGLSILDPTTLLPGVYFSVQNYLKASNTQPLCRIGVGADASGFSLESSMFDVYNWRSGDNRYYAKTYIPMAVSGLALSNASLSVMKGRAEQLTATLIPNYATNKNVTWSSSDSSVATVNSSGLVAGVGIGTAVITATTVDGGFTSSAGVTVTEFIPCNVPWSKSDFSITTSSKYYSSGALDISCEPSVNLTINLAENTSLEGSDTLIVSYIIDGVEYSAAKLVNDFTSFAVVKSGIKGNRLEIIIRGTQDAADEIYTISNFKVNGSGTNTAIADEIENSTDGLVKIYPNPVSNRLYVSHANAKGEINIKIVNLQGRVLYNKQAFGSITEIDVQELKSKGLLIVQVSTGKYISTFKISVVK